MPIELAVSIVAPIFIGKCDIRAVKHLEHGMKVVKRVLEKWFME